jgi:D-alanyl-D-alanine carboxypeptidase/D-alanyl-D-alanine-endopeptidase (penicillin-binding protein 4)
VVPRSLRIVAVATGTAVLAAAAGAGGYVGVHEWRVHHVAHAHPAPAPPPALVRATDQPSAAPSPTTSPPEPVPAQVAARLASLLAAPALGTHVLSFVADATSGDALAGHLADTPAAPASTAKLLTAAAVLAVRGPDYRITTAVVSGAVPGTVVLVGAGDPTLSAAVASRPTPYAGAARIADLAGQLRQAHTAVRRILVDGSAFTGPGISPQWAPSDVPSDYAAPITAVMADGGRAAPDDPIRTLTPDLAAGRALAADLGLSAAAVARGRAPAAAARLATVDSATMTQLVEEMLQESDNVIAECLARQVAIARHAPATFAGAAAAVRAVLAGLGADPGGGMHDGSGLAAADRLSPHVLVDVLRLIAGADHPQLRSVVDALPVAGWSGTLADRFVRGGPAATGAGVVRAKTGTLTGVSALAGLVHDMDGRLILFAVIADRVPGGDAGTAASDAALDRVAAALAGCGCS